MNSEGSKKRKLPYQLTHNPVITASSIAECRALLDAVERGEEFVKKTKFTEMLIDALVERNVKVSPEIKVPTGVIKKILLFLPPKECWRIARNLNTDFRDWVTTKLDVYQIRFATSGKSCPTFVFVRPDAKTLSLRQSVGGITYYRVRNYALIIQVYKRTFCKQDKDSGYWHLYQQWFEQNIHDDFSHDVFLSPPAEIQDNKIHLFWEPLYDNSQLPRELRDSDGVAGIWIPRDLVD